MFVNGMPSFWSGLLVYSHFIIASFQLCWSFSTVFMWCFLWYEKNFLFVLCSSFSCGLIWPSQFASPCILLYIFLCEILFLATLVAFGIIVLGFVPSCSQCVLLGRNLLLTIKFLLGYNSGLFHVYYPSKFCQYC